MAKVTSLLDSGQSSRHDSHALMLCSLSDTLEGLAVGSRRCANGSRVPLQISILKPDAGEAPALRARLAALQPLADAAGPAQAQLREAMQKVVAEGVEHRKRLAEMEGWARAASAERTTLMEQVWCSLALTA